MANITVKITDIAGESTLTGHEDELAAVAVRDLVYAPVGTGSAYMSEIAVTRVKDKGSPKLLQACAVGQNLGEVQVFMFTNTTAGPQPFMVYTLTEAFVSRIENETAQSNGGAYLAHNGYSQAGGSNHQAALQSFGLTMNADRSYARYRAKPNPLFPMPVGSNTDTEVERVWFNAATVRWTYTPFGADGVAGGAVEKGWNLQTSMAI